MDDKSFFDRFSGLKFGAIVASISSAWMLYLFITKSVISPSSRFSLLLIPLCLFVGIFLAIKSARKKNNDKLSFSEGLKVGLQTAVAYSIIMAVVTFICQAIIYPEFSIDAIANAKERGIQEKVNPKLMADVLSKMKEDVKVGSQVTKTIFGGLLTGTICSVLFSLLMKKE